jgi:hypothetical protein
MTVAQAVAHCSVSLEWALGDVVLPSGPLLQRTIGKVIKPMVFRDDEPFRRNAPTAKQLVIEGDRELRVEKERLLALIDRFVQGGAKGCTAHPHSFFGKLSPDEWAILMYKHLDHHLRQFGA